VNLPESLGIQQGRVIDSPVELMDLMPTFLDAAGVDVPGEVDGRSLLELARNAACGWREYVHGECASVPSTGSGMQYVTDGKRKYVWLPGQGVEQYFDLEMDPREMVELSGDPHRADEIAVWRSRLICELKGRAEGFTDGERLLKLSGPTA